MHPHPVFSPFRGENILVDPKRKTLSPHYLFIFLLTQPNTLQKSFLFNFLFKVFYLPYFTSKQTHPLSRVCGVSFLLYNLIFVCLFLLDFGLGLVHWTQLDGDTCPKLNIYRHINGSNATRH